MRKKIFSTVSIVFLILAFNVAEAGNAIYLDTNQPIEKRIENALSLMTLEEKVAMCHAQSKFSSKGVPRLGIPEVWMDDGPHGVREESLYDQWSGANWTNDSCTAFPALTCLAASFDPTISLLYGKTLGEEARYRNKTVLLGPGVNIYRTPMNGRNFEYMGEDPYLASRMVVPYIKGLQQNGVAACVKHFALNNQEINRGTINVKVSDRALYEIYLPAFKAAVIEGKVWTLMGAYNQMGGQHCCHNDLLLNQILKKDWKFDGVVISDWDGVHDTDQAATNGTDLEMGTEKVIAGKHINTPYSKFYLANPFLEGLKTGKYSEELVNEKVRRLLRLIFRTTMSANRPFGKFVSPEHSGAALQIAEQGIVLLKNEKQTLPVAVGKYKKIAVIGDNALRSLTIGGGSSYLKAAYEVSPLEGLIKKYGKETITYSQGYSADLNYDKEGKYKVKADSMINAAVLIAKNAEIVFVIGGLNKEPLQDSEGSDRRDFALPYEQSKLINALLAVNKNIVVVLCTGNAVEMPWVNQVRAIVQNWYLGSESGNALANIISGDVNPSGKLPFSFPKKLEDNAAISFGKISYPGDNVNVEYKEDILVGYRWFDTKKIQPLFAFGHGLSYTTFQLAGLKADKSVYSKTDSIRVKFTVKNTGLSNGAEVAQLYVSDPICSVARPAKELKSFQKVFLQAGEAKTIELTLKVSDFAFYDEANKDWKIESGDFLLHLGTSADKILQTIKVAVL